MPLFIMCRLEIFGALKNFNIKKGATVGILGIGGLGHLGIKFGKNLDTK